jgi:molybdate/tungstate transport system ATP-binding protein
VIKVEKINLQKGNFKLKNISFEIDRKSYFTILGKTGAGKTMLLESIAGLHKITGKILIKNKNITHLPPEKRDIGFVYQDFALFPHLTVLKNITFSSRYKKCLNKHEFLELTEMLDIKHILNRKINSLSGGEKQRVAIARAIYTKPEILLLDEPLSAIDPTFKSIIVDNLKSLIQKFNLTVIHVTHNFKEAAYLSDKIAIMLNGEIKSYGNSSDILNKPGTLEIAKFLGFKNLLSVELIDLHNDNNKIFTIDPLKIEISHNKIKKDYVFNGIIEKKIESSDYIKYFIKTKDNLLFVKKTRDNNIFNINDKIFIGFDKNNIHLIKTSQ